MQCIDCGDGTECHMNCGPAFTECERCDGSGFIVERNTFPMSYVGPGPAPDYARGVTDSRCDECHGRGVVS